MSHVSAPHVSAVSYQPCLAVESALPCRRVYVAVSALRFSIVGRVLWVRASLSYKEIRRRGCLGSLAYLRICVSAYLLTIERTLQPQRNPMATTPPPSPRRRPGYPCVAAGAESCETY